MTYNYKIEQIDDSQYQLELIYETSKEMMDWMFKKGLNKLKKKKNLSVAGNPDLIERFDIPESQRPLFCPPIKNAVKKHLRAVSKEIKRDGFILLTSEVTNAVFARKQDNKWKINVIIQGTFVWKK